jgi:hypothetical protein
MISKLPKSTSVYVKISPNPNRCKFD